MRAAFVATISALTLATAHPVLAQTEMSDADRTALREEIRAYLLESPEILMEMISLLEERQKAAASQGESALIAANAKAIFEDGFSHIAGNPEGSVTVVEFADYQCGFCRRAHPEVRELIESDGDIRLIIKEMPILGPGSELAARAAIATLITEGAKAYEALNDALMSLDGQVTDAGLDKLLADLSLDAEAVRDAMDDAEVERRIAETRALAQDLEISGTPTFVFEDRMIRGYVTLADMRELVDELRATN